MECPGCHYENADGARFCGECGVALIRDITCPSCGRSNPASQRFCNECGNRLSDPARSAGRDPRAYIPKHLAAKILDARSALEGERKQVTVLFADVKGSMELASQLDPEEWHRIMDRFFQLLAEGVHRFEGTVIQFTGDGIMALFGAPIAHEDHAQRACWTALHLSEALRRHADELRLGRGLNFSVRMGLNSGEVVVGKIGDDLHMEYTASGHTVGLAQRMEQLAAADRVYLTEHTVGLVEGYFRLRDLGALEVKGASAPVRVFELEGAGALHTRLDASRARGFTRFVGRGDEMAALEAALTRSLAGDGRVLGVVGEAGIGKSRLCEEFLERCRVRGIATYRAHGVAYGKAVPLLPILQLLRNVFGIAENDSPAIAREKIAGRLLLLDRAFDEGLPLLFDFLGVADPERPVGQLDAGARQRQLFELIRRVIQARRETTVTLLEDLHWFDAASEAFLGPLVAARAGTRSLLVLNFRPEYRTPWMQHSYYQPIALRPLGPEDAAELLRSLVGVDASFGELTAVICERTGGNPFFIEEVVRSLEETRSLVGARGAYHLAGPVTALTVPATVQAVLAARIDRLGEREKEVLQTAAVIGREFREGVLAQVAGRSSDDLAAALSALVAAEFVYETALHPEHEYAFAHPLTQEVAYGSQLADRRTQVHAAVARALEEGDAVKLDERAAVLAHHWEAAGEPLAAARWHRRAAVWALRTDFAEARRHWEQVRMLARRLSGTEEQAELGATACSRLLYLASRMGCAPDEATAVFEEGNAWAEATDNARLKIAVLYNYSRTWTYCVGDQYRCLDLLEEVLRIAIVAGDREAQFFVQAMTGMVLCSAGRPRDGLVMAEAALEHAAGDMALGSDVMGFSPYVFALTTRGVCRHALGHGEEGGRDAEQAVTLSSQLPSLDLVGLCHFFASWITFEQGDAAATMRHALAELDVASKVGNPSQEVMGHCALGSAHLVGGKWNEAVAAFDRCLELMRNHHTGLFVQALTLDRLAEALLGAGDTERARAVVDEAIAMAEKRGALGWGYRGPATKARVLLRSSGAAVRSEVEGSLAAAQTQVDRSGERIHQPHIHLARGELAAVLGDAAGRARELGEAHRLFTEMGATARASMSDSRLQPTGTSLAAVEARTR